MHVFCNLYMQYFNAPVYTTALNQIYCNTVILDFTIVFFLQLKDIFISPSFIFRAQTSCELF